jgi:hypothetical protein
MQWRTYQELQDPVLHIGKLQHELWGFINNGVYPFMLFACVCFAAISWLLFGKRESPPPIPTSPRTRAFAEIMAASPGTSQMLTVGAHP